MVNTEYQEGIDELKIKVGERNVLLTEVVRLIGNFFADPNSQTRLDLLNIYGDIREVLGLGGCWGDEG